MPNSQIQSSINQYLQLTGKLTDDIFCFATKGNSSVGAHIRHAIDRMNCFIDGLGVGYINYDLRNRNPQIETDRMIATEYLREINNFFLEFNKDELDEEILVIETLGTTSIPTKMNSTVKREIGDLIIHNTHHLAIIKVMLQSQSKLPEIFDKDFGKAASTVIYEKSSS